MGRKTQIAMKAAGYIAFLVMLASQALAQPVLPKTQAAQDMAQAGDLKAASLKITEALRDPAEANHAYPWYVKGYIHKRIYQEIEAESPLSENREIGLDALKTGLRLDTKREYAMMFEKAILFFALTYYNDAVKMIETGDINVVDKALRSYARHKELQRSIDPNADFAERDLELYKVVAGNLTILYHTDRDKNGSYYRSATDYYNIILEIAPDDYQANYNMAINHYNTGTHRLSKVNYQTEIFELIVLQDECITLFRAALPFMLKAFSIKPERMETLKGLMAIHLALGEDAKAEFFKNEIERLVKEGKLKP